MKSDEEFIAGIYAKAEAYQAEHAKQEDSNVIRISSFQRKIKKISAYAAGIAACFACGITVYLGTNVDKEMKDNSSFLEGRETQQNETTQPITIDSTIENKEMIRTQDEYGQQLHCTVTNISDEEGIEHIEAIVDSGETVTLLVPKENKSKLIEVGNEIVLSVNEPDYLGNYSILLNHEVYIYSGLENGEKVFTSENHTVLKESDLNTVK